MEKIKIKSFLGVEEMQNCVTLFQQLTAELIGSFLYLALILSAGNYSDKIGDELHGTQVIMIALSNGLILASVIQFTGHVSGGHVNPAVTLAAMICGHIKPLRAVCYVIVQVLGCIAGSAVAYGISAPGLRHNLGATVPYYDSPPYNIAAFEFLMTYLLISVVLSVLDKHRGIRGLGSSPLIIGVCVAGCNLACAQYTGSLNPARSLGPAVVMNIWTSHYVYWLGPLCGSLVAALVYKYVLSANKQQYIKEQYQEQVLSDLKL